MSVRQRCLLFGVSVIRDIRERSKRELSYKRVVYGKTYYGLIFLCEDLEHKTLYGQFTNQVHAQIDSVYT